jgi:hypothetical protein
MAREIANSALDSGIDVVPLVRRPPEDGEIPAARTARTVKPGGG